MVKPRPEMRGKIQILTEWWSHEVTSLLNWASFFGAKKDDIIPKRTFILCLQNTSPKVDGFLFIPKATSSIPDLYLLTFKAGCFPQVFSRILWDPGSQYDQKNSLGSRWKGWASDWWGKKLWSHTKVEEFQSCQVCPTSPTSRNCSCSFEKKLRIQLMTYVPVAQSKVHFNLITLLFFNITVLWYSWWSATLGHFSPQKILCTKSPMFCSPAAGMEVVVLKSQTVFRRLQLNARFGNGGKRSDLFLWKKGGYEVESKIRSKFIFQADFCWDACK